jgi:hypothetical protein
MKKPKSKKYYDWHQVIRYLTEKYKLPKYDYFLWVAERSGYSVGQNSLVSLYISDYLPNHEEYPCDEFCPCISTPKEICDFLVGLQEIEPEEIALKMWW